MTNDQARNQLVICQTARGDCGPKQQGVAIGIFVKHAPLTPALSPNDEAVG